MLLKAGYKNIGRIIVYSFADICVDLCESMAEELFGQSGSVFSAFRRGGRPGFALLGVSLFAAFAWNGCIHRWLIVFGAGWLGGLCGSAV